MLPSMCLRSTVEKLGNVCDVIQFQNCYYVGSHTLYMYCRGLRYAVGPLLFSYIATSHHCHTFGIKQILS